MKLFKRYRNNERNLPAFLVRMLSAINNQLLVFSRWLQFKTQRYSSLKLKIIFLFFTLAFAVASILVIYESAIKHTSTYFFIAPIQAVPLLKEKAFKPVITKEEMNKIRGYKTYLDSVRNSVKTKGDTAAFSPSDGHLLDTIKLLEQLYYEQQTNKN